MKLLALTLALALCLSTSLGDELTIMEIPHGIKLTPAGFDQHLDSREISNFVTYLMGFSTKWKHDLKGVSVDMFHPPHANFMLNVHLPKGQKLTWENRLSYKIDNEFNLATSLMDTNDALLRNYHNSVVLDPQQEISDQIFNTLPKSMEDIGADLETFLMNKPLIKDILKDNLHQDVYTFFIAELHQMWNILAQLKNNKDLVDDGSPDNYLLTITSIDKLANTYGSDSEQVAMAIDTLQAIIPLYLKQLQDLYNGQLLAEVVTTGPVQHQFNDVQLDRSRRSTTDDNTTEVKGQVEPNKPERTIILNIAIWITVVMALATLAVAYSIWYMDPGHDSIIYRTATHRMKID